MVCLLALDCEFREGETVVSFVLMPNVLVSSSPLRGAALHGLSEPKRNEETTYTGGELV